MDQLTDTIVSVRGIGKRYAGATALDAVDLAISRGSVHALIGENGAGKSTLGKIIAGVIQPDSGTLLVDGAPVVYQSPADALRQGIAAIQQEIALVPARSAVENVFLGVEPRRRGLPDSAEMRRRFAELNDALVFNLKPEVIVGTLRTGAQQKVEIMRAVARNARLIVMDEPTAALGADEVGHLLEAVRTLQARGTTIIFVSHRLEEVKAIADEVTVLRNGKLVMTIDEHEATAGELVSAMLGRSLESSFPPIPPVPADAPVVLSAQGLTRAGAFEDISLEVRAGEIVGLAGLVGAGRTEVVRAIFGADRADSGLVEIDGEHVKIRSPMDAVEAGIALLPESRKDQGLLMGNTVGVNLTLVDLSRITRNGVLSRSRERAGAEQAIRELDIRPANPGQIVRTLSGGNQQKVLFGKWLIRRPKVLIVDEPTRGVDVGAKFAIYELLAGLASEGLAVLIVSSELEEILGLAHRVLVMRQGRIVSEFPASEATEDRVMHAAFGTATTTEVG